MTDKVFLGHGAVLRRVRLGVTGIAICALGLGCNAFNPAFLDLLDTEGTGVYAALDNAPGHVVILFVNNAEVDERLLNYLETSGGLVLTEAEKREIRPRVRIRVRVTFTDGASQVIEFVDGSSNLVDQSFNVQTTPDLNQNDLNNTVVLCDVARVEIEPGTDIEVFIPVELEVYEFREVQGAQGGEDIGTYVLREQIAPHFQALRVDNRDEDGNVILRRNIGVRDVPAPVPDPTCGSVVPITMNGVLTVPFLDEVTSAPSYDRADTPTEAGIGGRYEFIVSVQ